MESKPSEIDSDFDIDSLRLKNESDNEWLLRRTFIQTRAGKFPLQRLLYLSSCFVNMITKGDEYPPRIMDEMNILSQDLQDVVKKFKDADLQHSVNVNQSQRNHKQSGSPAKRIAQSYQTDDPFSKRPNMSQKQIPKYATSVNSGDQYNKFKESKFQSEDDRIPSSKRPGMTWKQTPKNMTSFNSDQNKFNEFQSESDQTSFSKWPGMSQNQTPKNMHSFNSGGNEYNKSTKFQSNSDQPPFSKRPGMSQKQTPNSTPIVNSGGHYSEFTESNQPPFSKQPGMSQRQPPKNMTSFNSSGQYNKFTESQFQSESDQPPFSKWSGMSQRQPPKNMASFSSGGQYNKFTQFQNESNQTQFSNWPCTSENQTPKHHGDMTSFNSGGQYNDFKEFESESNQTQFSSWSGGSQGQTPKNLTSFNSRSGGQYNNFTEVHPESNQTQFSNWSGRSQRQTQKNMPSFNSGGQYNESTEFESESNQTQFSNWPDRSQRQTQKNMPSFNAGGQYNEFTGFQSESNQTQFTNWPGGSQRQTPKNMSSFNSGNQYDRFTESQCEDDQAPFSGRPGMSHRQAPKSINFVSSDGQYNRSAEFQAEPSDPGAQHGHPAHNQYGMSADSISVTEEPVLSKFYQLKQRIREEPLGAQNFDEAFRMSVDQLQMDVKTEFLPAGSRQFICEQVIDYVTVGRGYGPNEKIAKVNAERDMMDRLNRPYLKVVWKPELVGMDAPLASSDLPKHGKIKRREHKKHEKEVKSEPPTVPKVKKLPLHKRSLEKFVVVEKAYVKDSTPVMELQNCVSFNRGLLQHDYVQCFGGMICTININGEQITGGTGLTKAEARSAASANALKVLKGKYWTIKVKQAADLKSSAVTREQFYAHCSGGGGNNSSEPIPDSNVGNKLLKMMGWSGGGLGKNEQGIEEPISAGPGVKGKGLGFRTQLQKGQSLEKAACDFIKNYLMSDQENDLVFSQGFTKRERAILHDQAQKLGLKSQSHGFGDNRFLVLSTKRTASQLFDYIKQCGGSTIKYELVPPAGST